jgi:endosialidase-like protein
MNPLIRSKTILPILIALILPCFALSPTASAVNPPPDGGYPGNNTAEGDDALLRLANGTDNTAVGFQALLNNSNGRSNTAVGSQALYSNRISQHNTAIGFTALFSNTDGGGNTAVGESALYGNKFGGSNTAIGFDALIKNISSYNNTAIGASALGNNTEGYSNTAIGVNALLSNSVGQYNTAIGLAPLLNNTTGNYNVAIGYEAGINLTRGDNNIDIDNLGVPGEANTIRIGKQGTQTATFIAGVSGATVPTGVAVIVDSSGHLGTSTSSVRFKESIRPMDKASEPILALKPVTFRYTKELDPKGTQQFGLVAEDVEKINPDLVARDADGKAYTVRYEAVNAMLLNEFLKEHRKNEEQESKIEQQGATIARQQKQIDALTAGLQRVSAQLDLSKSIPQTVLNNQ